MAISFVGQTSAAGTTSALPEVVKAGDLLLVFAYCGSTAVTPAAPSGFTTISSGAGNGNGHQFGYKIATASDAVGAWTGAEYVIVHAYRGVHPSSPIGGSAQMTNIAAITYPAVGMATSDGTSWVAGFAGSKSTAEGVGVPPAGMTNRSDLLMGGGSEVAGHDTDAGVASWAAQTGGNGTTGGRYRSVVAEIRAAASMPASSSGSTAVALGAARANATGKLPIQARTARTLGAVSTASAAKLVDSGRLGGALASLTLRAAVASSDPREVTISSGIALIVDQGRFDTQGKTTSANFWVTPEYGKGYMQVAHGGGNKLQVDVGSRFVLPNVIPKGSKIVSASFLLYALVGTIDDGSVATNNVASPIPIRGDAGHQGNAPRYFAGDTVQVTPTSASVTLQNSNVDKTPLYHDVTGIMQELVDAFDQQAVFLYTDATAMPLPSKTESEYFYSQAEDANYTPRLTVVYVPAGVSGTVTATLGGLVALSHGGLPEAARVIATLGALRGVATAAASLRAQLGSTLGGLTSTSSSSSSDSGAVAGHLAPLTASAAARTSLIAEMTVTLGPAALAAAAHSGAFITVPAARILRLHGVDRRLVLTGMPRLIILKEAP